MRAGGVKSGRAKTSQNQKKTREKVEPSTTVSQGNLKEKTGGKAQPRWMSPLGNRVDGNQSHTASDGPCSDRK